MAINLNNTIPSPPIGGTNVLWQEDSSGNVSAYTGLATAKTTVAPVAGVVSVAASLGNSFLVNVTSAITSMPIANPTDGQIITVLFVQDSTGHAVTLSANVLGSYSITTIANKRSCYSWMYDAVSTNWFQVGANNM